MVEWFVRNVIMQSLQYKWQNWQYIKKTNKINSRFHRDGKSTDLTSPTWGRRQGRMRSQSRPNLTRSPRRRRPENVCILSSLISWYKPKRRRKNLTRSWVYSSTPRSQIETDMLTSWNPLKSCRVPFKLENYPLGVVQAREFHNTKEIHHRNKPPSNSSPKTTASTTEERNVFHHLFRRRELNFDAWNRLFSLSSDCLFLLCLNEFSLHDIVLHTKWDVKAFPVPLFWTNVVYIYIYIYIYEVDKIW